MAAECAGITEPAERLACYDGTATPLHVPAVKASAAARSQFANTLRRTMLSNGISIDENAAAAGFKGVEFMSKGSGSWFYDVSGPQLPQCDVFKRLCF